MKGTTKWIFALLISGICCLPDSNADIKGQPDAIIGTWLIGTGKGKVKIEKIGSTYSGKIAWLKEPVENGKPKTDKENPDKAKRSLPLMGMVMMKDFVYNSKENIWEKGTIYDPENGKTYSCELRLPEEKKLYVRGFIGISLIGRTDTWFKVMDVK